MNIIMQVEYEREEVYAIMIAAHTQKFGPAPKGYHYACSGYYFDITVNVVKDEKVEAPQAVPTAKPEDCVPAIEDMVQEMISEADHAG